MPKAKSKVKKCQFLAAAGLFFCLFYAHRAAALVIDAQPMTTCSLTSCKTCVNLDNYGLNSQRINKVKAANLTAFLPKVGVNLTEVSYYWTANTLCLEGRIQPLTATYWSLPIEANTSIDPWWNSSYVYCRNLTITAATNITDYQMFFNLSMTDAADFTNLTFVNDSCNVGNVSELPFWIESKNTSNWMRGYVRGNALNATNISVYYSNTSAATNLSNGYKTFILFDDFQGATLNTTQWTFADTNDTANGDYQISNGYLNLSSKSSQMGPYGTFGRTARIYRNMTNGSYTVVSKVNLTDFPNTNYESVILNVRSPAAFTTYSQFAACRIVYVSGVKMYEYIMNAGDPPTRNEQIGPTVTGGTWYIRQNFNAGAMNCGFSQNGTIYMTGTNQALTWYSGTPAFMMETTTEEAAGWFFSYFDYYLIKKFASSEPTLALGEAMTEPTPPGPDSIKAHTIVCFTIKPVCIDVADGTIYTEGFKL